MYYDKLPIIILSEMASSKSNAINGYIATYILGHLDEIKEDSIRDLANRVNVSASSISRFCRDIGLKDYNELKALLNDTTLKFDICSYADTVPERKDDYVAAVQQCLEQVRTSIDMAKVRALCMDIRRYEQVAVFGVLKAEGVAMNLQTDLAMQGKHVITKLPYSEQIDYLDNADKRSLVIIFSYTGIYYQYGLPKSAAKPKSKPRRFTSSPAIPGRRKRATATR